MNESTELVISVLLDDGDQVELQELTEQLQLEIEQLHVNSLEKVSISKLSKGEKGVDWTVIGEMAVALAPIVIPPLFEILKSWINRHPSVPVKIKVRVGKNRTAQIEYDPTKTSAQELEALIKTLGRSIKR